MKKINKGFTLAEVLFALAIIGIVATMTLPSIQASFLRQQVATGLAKAINTLENANALALQENNAKDFRDLGITTTNYLDFLKNYIYLTDGPASQTYKTHTNGSKTVYQCATSKDGITFFKTYSSSPNNPVLSRAYSGYAYSILVDINGYKKGPNVHGKDLYDLYVDSKGSVIPIGGTLYKMYKSTPNLVNQCTKNNWGNSGWFNASQCSGSVVDNGYKVIEDTSY